jgi:hypothetical protein
MMAAHSFGLNCITMEVLRFKAQMDIKRIL